jgi:adenine-specific DNA methylase
MSEEQNRNEEVKIQDHLPIRTIGIETERENLDFQHRPPHRYAHRWFASRPTPASRAAILASVLPKSIDDDTLLKWMGFQPSNKPEGVSIAEHVRKKRETKDQRKGAEHEHYGYRKIWRYSPDRKVTDEIQNKVKKTWGGELPNVLDATAGGGTIPLESLRYDMPTIANELNPVPSVILRAILEKTRTESDLSEDILKWGKEIDRRARDDLKKYFPEREGERIQSYLWAHQVRCPDCGLKVPLSSNWWLSKGSTAREGTAAQPQIDEETDEVSFQIVELPSDVNKDEFNPTDGTISYGKMTCPRCDVTMDSDSLKELLRDDDFNYQLYSIYYGQHNQKGMSFRTPDDSDIRAFEEAKALVRNDVDLSTILSIDIPHGEKTTELRRNGMDQWRDVYSPRQLLTHHIYYNKYNEVKQEIKEGYTEDEYEAIVTYLSLTADKALDYNSRMSSWEADQPMINATFAGSDFAFSWSFQEHNLIVDDHGYDWIINNLVDVYEGVREQLQNTNSPATVLQDDAADLPLDSESIETVVLDPPYYGMVMYAELSDYFYVWMKTYLSDVYPSFFSKELSDKTEEAVANPSKFEDIGSESMSKTELAKREYEEKMTSIFSEMNRVLTNDGVFTMMFTHRKTEAWDTLTTALIKSGFTVTSTHPINTENQHRVQQSGKNSTDSTILLTSEKRSETSGSASLWEDIQAETKRVAEERVKMLEQEDAEFTKVDMILASFGPTLEVFTQNYPVVDDQGDEVPPQKALEEARSAVRNYLTEKYLNEGIQNIDPKSEWYIFAWFVFEAQRFPYDEGRQLAVGVGEDVDSLKKDHRMWRTKSGDIVLRGHNDRVQDINKNKDNRSGRLPVDPEALSFTLSLDKVHAAMHVYETRGSTEAWNWMNDRNCGSDPAFKATLEALLRVLPHDNADWNIGRDLAAGETGELLDLELEAGVFQGNGDDENRQESLEDF